MLTGEYPFLKKNPISFTSDNKFTMGDASGTWKIIEQDDTWQVELKWDENHILFEFMYH